MQTTLCLAWLDDLIAIGHVGPPTLVKLTDDRQAETSEPRLWTNLNTRSIADGQTRPRLGRLTMPTRPMTCSGASVTSDEDHEVDNTARRRLPALDS
jgi:hypothetical protein